MQSGKASAGNRTPRQEKVPVSELGVVYRNIDRADGRVADQLGVFGSAMVHEAMGRFGVMKPYLRPIYPGARVSGTAVTVLLPPGDNWMLHVAVEQVRPGDVVVAAATNVSNHGFFDRLLATSLKARGARGLVIDGGCRHVGALTEMGFPVWSRVISARGTAQTALGSVNVPISCAGVRVQPGDVIVADDDGVVCVPSGMAQLTLDAAIKRDAWEQETAAKLASGMLGLDLCGMREPLAKLGLRYVDHDYGMDTGANWLRQGSTYSR